MATTVSARIGSCMINLLPPKERISTCSINIVRPPPKPKPEFHNHGHGHGHCKRRSGLLLILSTTLLLVGAPSKAKAEEGSQTLLLQKYLKKSEENKAKNDKERLDQYYKRNYRDYFDFVEGSVQGKTRDQLSDSEKAILDWLQANR